MDKIGQEITVGNYILIMRKGSGWDKSTYFSVDFVYKTTPAMAFYGDPENKTRIKHDSVIVLTDEQMTLYCIKEYGEEEGRERAQESIDYRNRVLGL